MNNRPSNPAENVATVVDMVKANVNHLGELHLDDERTELLISYICTLEAACEKYKSIGDQLKALIVERPPLSEGQTRP